LISSSETINTSYIISIRNLTLVSASNPAINQTNELTAILNQKKYNKNSAYFSIAKTSFVCIILFVLIQMFTTDIETYIVEPI
jgi:hypothetical protein